ncbi:MAG: transporter substrate-binding domain-containing protein [Desulfosalsimonas sp.]|uniref:transporter substrate-binding domain-containing diguanylate cyclase n=1 Tax=Desulfosalsimonas sp. TaxID=3073848 RepID=UPI003970905D
MKGFYKPPVFIFLLICLPAVFFAAQGSFAEDGPAGRTGLLPSAVSVSPKIELSAEERAFLENHPVIRVGNEDDWPPFDFSEHGRPKGYAIEHLELLGRRLGLSFQYVNGYSWFELLGLLKQGKIDLLPCLWISESRKRFMRFTGSYLELPYVIVAAKENAGKFQTVENLSGKTVAAARGYKQEEVLLSAYPEIDVFQVQNAQEGLEAVVYGEADAYIGYLGSVAYLMATRFLGSLQICGETRGPELGPQGLHMAVRPEMDLLAGILEKAMETVTDREKVELAEKWISVEQTRVPDLTVAEKVFLRKNPVLRVDNLQNWPPFNFNDRGRPRGFCIDYMELLAGKLGVEVEYVTRQGWNDIMEMLQSGDIDCLCDVVPTPDRKKYIEFTDSYLTIFSGIVVRQGKERFTRLRDLAGRKVAVPEGFYYQELLNKHYPDLEIVAQKDSLACLKAVSSGEVDAALAEKPVFDHLIRQHFLTDLKSVPVMDSRWFENTPVSIGVSKDRAILGGILQKAMDRVTQDELTRLYRRWLDREQTEWGGLRVMLSQQERQWLEEKGEIRICGRPSWLPFEEIDKNGVHRGISADIMALLEERIGVPIRFVPTKSWEQSIEALESDRCDLLSAVSKSRREKGSFVVSKPYIESVNVMVARDGQPYIPDLHALEGRKVGIVQDNPVADYLRDQYPGIRLRFYPDLKGVLRAVAKDEAEIALGSLHRVSYILHELGLYDLKIAGQTPYKEQLGLGIAGDNQVLASIMDKALESVSGREVSRITRKWLSIRYDKGFDTLLLFQILGVVAVLMSLFAFWNRKLARLNRDLGIAHQALAVKSRELERLSVTDALTGIFNRLKTEDLLLGEIRRIRRTRQPFSVIMLDVDHFKQINDSYGHQTGDHVLKQITGLLHANIRQADSIGRWGGEEFLVLCPDTSIKGAVILAQHLRNSVAGQQFSAAGRVTCSFGVAEYHPGEGITQLLRRVDRAMYLAKQRGRNRVEVLE